MGSEDALRDALLSEDALGGIVFGGFFGKIPWGDALLLKDSFVGILWEMLFVGIFIRDALAGGSGGRFSLKDFFFFWEVFFERCSLEHALGGFFGGDALGACSWMTIFGGFLWGIFFRRWS